MSLYNFSLSRLRRTFTRFFVPLRPPTIPLVFEVDGNNYGIQSWAKYINVTEAQQCSVVSLDHRRTPSKDSQHEFLLITLWHPQDYETIMTAERVGFESNSSELSGQANSATSLAKDRVRFSSHIKDSHRLGCWLFNDPRPSVADLCSVLYVVSDHFPCEHPCENQSFWFARTVYGVLTKEYAGREVAGRGVTYSISDSESLLSIRKKYRTVWAEFVARTTADREAHLEQARAKGREEGLEEGRAAGRAESEAKITELRRQLAMD